MKSLLLTTLTTILFSLLPTLTNAASALFATADDECTTISCCKHWKFCCDNEICNNNCKDVPICAKPGPKQNIPWMDTAIMICEDYFLYECCRDADGCGDPHFRTWNGDWFDFHGECDLEFLKAPQFGSGLGLQIQVRTKIRNDFSYIEAAVVRIGDDVLEVGAWGAYLLNGVEAAALPHGRFEIASFPITYSKFDDATHNYQIFLGDHSSLLLKSFKDYVSVKFVKAKSDDFMESTGLLGDFITGNKLARDGTTIMEDPIQYGLEWQVRPETDGVLFQSDADPQYPQQCRMPALTADGRRLAEAKVSEEDAQAACAHVYDETYRKLCVYDVKATGDLSLGTADAVVTAGME